MILKESKLILKGGMPLPSTYTNRLAQLIHPNEGVG